MLVTFFSFSSSYLPYVGAALYVSIEICFGLVFYWYMIPRANELTEPAPYRDYGNDRLKLMLRIMHRIEAICRITQADENVTMKQFLTEWFHIHKHHNGERNVTTRTTSKKRKKQPPQRSTTTATTAPDITYTPSSSPENSDDENSESSSSLLLESSYCDMQLCRQEMDDFFAWAFYGKFHSNLKPQELQELDRIYKELEDRHELVFPIRTSTTDHHHREQQRAKPRCMTLEPVNTMYRPLFVYLLVYGMKVSGGLFLRLMGYRRIVASTGLVAWHRPSRNTAPSSSSMLPMLFFHGIAPGGFVLYLPMLFWGLATEPDRPVFIFENRTISCAIDFHPLTEEQTVDGVVEILQMFDMDQRNLSLVGHSFGSCVVTWMIMSKRLPNIKHVVLIDPVAILLSEPDVMVNFLYAEELDRIRMVASSELFTEYYLRRHFAWYNSELWLEDVNCPMLIGLSENDEIINSRKVKQEIERHSNSAKLVFWDSVGHGACIQSPARWKQMKSLMLEQELKIVQETRQ
jgi:pimeloyl-ACP methyl ester carboxylesterase